MNNDFAMTPDNGPARIFRRVKSSFFPVDNVVAVLDRKTNVLRVNEDVMVRLPELYQNIVFKTQREVLFIEEFQHVLDSGVVNTTDHAA